MGHAGEHRRNEGEDGEEAAGEDRRAPASAGTDHARAAPAAARTARPSRPLAWLHDQDTKLRLRLVVLHWEAAGQVRLER